MATVRARPKLAVVVAAALAAAAGAAAAVLLLTDGGEGAPRLQTTGDYAPISVKRPRLYTAGGALLSDPDAGVQTYLNTMVAQLPGKNRYRVTVSNVSNLGFIDAFQWYPPTGVHVVGLSGSSAGTCALTGLGGFGGNQFKTAVLYPNIACKGVDLKPPSCTCLGDGGSVEITLVTDGAMAASGAARMIAARVAIDPIPSFLPSGAPAAGAPVGQAGSGGG